MIELEYPEALEVYVPSPSLEPAKVGVMAELQRLADQAMGKLTKVYFPHTHIVGVLRSPLEIVDPPPRVLDVVPYMADMKFAHMTARVWLSVIDQKEMDAIYKEITDRGSA